MLAVIAIIVIIVAIIGFLGVQGHKQSRARLFQNSELMQADRMSGPEFEKYFADLLRLRGYHGVRVVGGAGDGGVDILATAPNGGAVAWQCKRQVANVSVQVVRQLIGSVSFEHRGRLPCLVTTAILTKPAADLARQSGVQVVDRSTLGGLMAEARQRLSAASNAGILLQRQALPGSVRADGLAQVAQALVMIGRVMLVVVTVLVTVLLQVLTVAATPPRSQRRRRSPARRRPSSTRRPW